MNNATSTLLARYTWIVDTIRRVGRITRKELNRRWEQSSVSGGSALPRRTFYNYREAIYDLFGVEIRIDTSTNEYYIETELSESGTSITDLLLDSAAMSGILADAQSISSRIFLENVPSARTNLAPIISAIKENRAITFSYHPYTRSVATTGIVLEPFLIKLFKQRWYVAGRNVGENRLKTYALDRMSAVEITSQSFELPSDFNPQEYFKHSFGIVVDSSEPRQVTIRAGERQAKYMRALPLHPSQQEMVNNGYSLFHYSLLLTPDLVSELMAMGPDIEILAPAELRILLANRLSSTLALYK